MGEFEQPSENTDQHVEPVTDTAQPEVTEQPQQEDTRWDEDKARTLASAIKNDTVLNGLVEHHAEIFSPDGGQLVKSDYSDAEASSEAVDASKKRLEELENSEFEPDSRFPTKEAAIKDAKHWAAINEYKLDANLELGAATLERDREQVHKNTMRRLSPFEELYDVNPAKFADMPTSEFVVLGGELAGYTHALNLIARANGNIDSIKADITKDTTEQAPDSLLERYGDDGEEIENIAACIGAAEGMSEEDEEKFANLAEEQFAEIFSSENRFNKSPKQLLEDYDAFVNTYRDRAAAAKTKIQAQYQEILDRFKPESQHQPDSNPAT